MTENKNKSMQVDNQKNYTPISRPDRVDGNYIPTTNQQSRPAQNDRPKPSDD